MDLTNESKNPFLRDLLLSAACTLVMFALFSYLYRYSSSYQRLYRVLSPAVVGGSGVYLARSLLSYFRYAAFARRHEGGHVDLEHFLDEQRTRQASGSDAVQIAVSALMFLGLVLLLPLGGKAASQLIGTVSAEELAGTYELTEVRGDDELSSAFSTLKTVGLKLTLEIDETGNGTLRAGSLDFMVYRFDLQKKVLMELKDGEETGRGSRFTWKNGVLTINDVLVFQKTGAGN